MKHIHLGPPVERRESGLVGEPSPRKKKKVKGHYWGTSSFQPMEEFNQWAKRSDRRAAGPKPTASQKASSTKELTKPVAHIRPQVTNVKEVAFTLVLAPKPERNIFSTISLVDSAERTKCDMSPLAVGSCFFTPIFLSKWLQVKNPKKGLERACLARYSVSRAIFIPRAGNHNPMLARTANDYAMVLQFEAKRSQRCICS